MPLDRVDQPLLGVALASATVFMFALSDVLNKHLAMSYPAEQVIAVRYLASLILLMIFVWPRIGKRLWSAARPALLVTRGLVLCALSFTLVMALKLMPVGETIAIIYLSPLVVMVLAAILFGERTSVVSWILASIGFGGVLLIVRPGTYLDPVGISFALGNAAAGTTLHLMTRQLSGAESAISMLFYATLTGTVVFTAWALPGLISDGIPLLDLLLMVMLGAIVTYGHFLFAEAYAYAPATLIAPVQYVHLVWAALLGWLVFGHIPDSATTLGMSLIVCAGVLLAMHSHFSEKAGPH